MSSTLEYTYDDFCVAQVARATGHTDIYDLLMKRSKNYVNVYNAQTGFMSPRNYDGSWHENTKAGFTEGSPWTYMYAAQHDIPGLIRLMGGDKLFIDKLNENFVEHHYVHENERGITSATCMTMRAVMDDPEEGRPLSPYQVPRQPRWHGRR